MFTQILERLLLNKGYGVLDTVENGKEVINLLEHNSADLILMDYDMPVLDGIEATKIITESYPNTDVLMLSMYSQPPYVQQALDVGVKGYIPKSADPAEIEFAIKEIRKGNIYISPSITKNLFENKNQNEKIKLS